MNTIEYDSAADALYITLREEPYAYGRDLDDSRRVDYAEDGEPVGVEILFPSRGINTQDLPLDPSLIDALASEYSFAVRG